MRWWFENKNNNQRARRLLQAAFGLFVLAWPVSSLALTELSDAQMASVSGKGLAFSLQDFRYVMAPTSYIDLLGTPVTTDPATTGNYFQQGDIKYFGLSISSGADTAGSMTDWFSDTPGSCSAGGLGCSIGGTITNMAAFDNPYVMRVFTYSSNMGGNPVYAYSGAATPTTVFELLGPTKTDSWRWGFWGEIQATVTNTAHNGQTLPSVSGLLKSQTLILGKPSATLLPLSVCGSTGSGCGFSSNPAVGDVFRILQDTAQGTFGMTYTSAMSGDFRFSVNQASTGHDAEGVVPQFGTTSGVFFYNVSAYLPLGQLAYQSLTLNDTAAHDGNFTLELTSIPNTANIYNDFYSLSTAPNGSDTAGCAYNSGGTLTYTSTTCGYTRTSRPIRYYNTHGYVEWGTGFPSSSQPNQYSGSNLSCSGITSGSCTSDPTVATGPNNNTDGMSFRAAPGTTFTASASNTYPGVSYSNTGQSSVNIGTSRIEGLSIQHLVLTTCGAGGGAGC